MKRLSFLLIVFALPLCARAADKPPRGRLYSPLDTAAGAKAPESPAPWYGERLEVAVGWGLITVGHATMEVSDVVKCGDASCYHILSTAKTNSVTDKFFKVRDINESWIGVKDSASRGYLQLMREGHYLWDEWVLFDLAGKKFNGEWMDRGGNRDKMSGSIPGPVQDMLSSLYYVRAQKLEVGRDIILDVNNRENWPMVVKVTGREKLSLGIGKFDCFVVEPKVREKGLFVQKGKRLRVWITDDKYHTPVMMRSEVFIGNVTAWLTKLDRSGK